MLLTQRIQETNSIPAKIHGTGKFYLHVHLIFYDTLQGINVSHLGKRKIIFKKGLGRGYVSFQEGNLLGTYTTRNEM